MSMNLHPKGLCVPCCFKTDQSESENKKYLYEYCMHGKDTNYKKEIADQNKKNIYKENKKLEKGRYGFLDNIIDIFLNNKTSKN